jgi:hypothetical protein
MQRNHRQIDNARHTSHMVNALTCLYIVFWFGKEDIGHERLRVSIVVDLEREPTGLDLLWHRKLQCSRPRFKNHSTIRSHEGGILQCTSCPTSAVTSLEIKELELIPIGILS